MCRGEVAYRRQGVSLAGLKAVEAGAIMPETVSKTIRAE